MAKRSDWMRGLLWAEECIKNNGLLGAGILIESCTEEASFFGDYTDFDRGADACLRHYKELSHGHH